MAITPKTVLVTVATGGTAVPVIVGGNAKPVVSATIQCVTGTIYVGASDVDATAKNGIQLTATGQAQFSLASDQSQAIDLSRVYINSAASGDKALVLFFEKQSR